MAVWATGAPLVIVSKVIGRSELGGYVSISAQAVHAHRCPYWRMGKRHGDCTCGALEVWADVEKGIRERIDRLG